MNDIPIYVLCFERVECLKALIPQLEGLDNIGELVLIDNASTSKELADFLAASGHRVIQLGSNVGPIDRWGCLQSADLTRNLPRHFAVVDCDVLLDDCPKDVLDHLRRGAMRHGAASANLAVSLLDLAQPSLAVATAEALQWGDEIEPGVWYRHQGRNPRFTLYQTGGAGKPITSYHPYVCRHQSWILDDTEEYLEHRQPTATPADDEVVRMPHGLSWDAQSRVKELADRIVRGVGYDIIASLPQQPVPLPPAPDEPDQAAEEIVEEVHAAETAAEVVEDTKSTPQPKEPPSEAASPGKRSRART